MAELETTSSPRRTCRRCHTDLPAGVSEDQCPKCLLAAGLQTQTLPDAGGETPPRLAAKSRGLPQPGDQFGHYRIARLLGEGGMGAVFDAEDVESGRRVALKVLSQTLDAPEARARFLREGRLAASINHPNSVYVFGTEEIAGTPVIAMELVPGGTLHDRVRANGPLAVPEAVDAMLEIIAGLEAAQRIGILHRDIKPSNCFRGEDGTVKIGDFGLSISTAIRTEPALTGGGVLLGTPAYCSPEQLRGEELNARSDLYSVGVTLYFLLTGRTPFDAPNLVQLLANVLEKRPPSPRQLRPAIPQGLAKAVLRCLEKEPGDRFKSYDELRQALAPYGSTAPTPATLGLRFVAGAVDMTLLTLVSGAAAIARFGNPADLMDRMAQRSPETLAWMLGGFCVSVLYYAVAEGLWGATPGKALCRLRVAGTDNSPPGLLRGLMRSLIYLLLPVLPFWIFNGRDPVAYLRGPAATQYLVQYSSCVVIALLFCTVRRRNGFAAIHDLATRSRVILRAALQARPLLAAAENPPAAVETRPQIGPYHVLEPLGAGNGVEWLLGYDLRLLRKVWLRVVPPGTPPVPAAWRNRGRAGSLRWLAGRRAPDENWDAFEGVTGQPLSKLAQTPQPWSNVRFWLHDLASELSAAQKDGSLPALALDRVWITGDGRAKLLDFPAPGVGEPINPPAAEISGGPATRFLGELAATALAGTKADNRTVLLPLHARHFLNQLPTFPDAAAAKAALQPLLQRLAVVTRWRRAAIVAGCIAVPLFAALGSIEVGALLRGLSQKNPGLLELTELLQTRSNTRRFDRPGLPEDRHYAVFIASHHRALITNESAWSGPVALTMIKGESRRFAEQAVAGHPDPAGKEIAEAEAALKPFRQGTPFSDPSKWRGFPLIVAKAVLLFYVALPGLLAALLFRGGLVQRIANVTFVRRDGAPASRLRLLWRALVAWVPVVVAVSASMATAHLPAPAPALAAGAVGTLALLSLALPVRGLPDRLAGTWPVPR